MGSMRSTLFRAVFSASLPVLVFADIFSLSDLSWTLKNKNESIVVPAKVPSQAHLDLYAAGIIPDPLLEQNGMSEIKLVLRVVIFLIMSRVLATLDRE